MIFGNREIHAGQRYKHFKGRIYTVDGIARHTEIKGMVLVIYHITGKYEQGLFARPIEMFLSLTDKKKYPQAKQKYRFQLLAKESKNG